MNSLHTIYLLSTTGAAVFYAAGFLTRSLPRAKVAVTQEAAVDTQAFAAELASVRSQLGAARSEAKQLRIALDFGDTQKNVEVQRAVQEGKGREEFERKRAALEGQLQQSQQALREAESTSEAWLRDLRQLRAELERERMSRKQLAAEMETLRQQAELGTFPDGVMEDVTLETQPFGVRFPRDVLAPAVPTISAQKGREVLISSTLAGVGEDKAKSIPQALPIQLERALADASQGRQRVQALEKQLRDSQNKLRTAETRAEKVKSLEVLLAEKTGAIGKLEKELSQARAKASALECDAKSVAQAELAARAAALAELEQALSEERTKVRALESERTQWRKGQADQSSQEIERLRQERIELKGQIERQGGASDEVDALKSELRQAKLELETARRKAGSAAALQEELDELKQQIALGGDVDALRREVNESRNNARQLRIDAQVAADRIALLQEAADEVVTLRAQVKELESKQRENEQLKGQMRVLKSRALASDSAEQPQAPPKRNSAFPHPRIDDALAGVLRAKAMRSAVVADRMGLLVSGVGDAAYHEGMGAMAGVIGEIVQRANDLLPLGGLRSIHLADANNLVVSCGLARWMQEDVVLVTLSSGMPSSDIIDSTLHSIASSTTEQRPSAGS